MTAANSKTPKATAAKTAPASVTAPAPAAKTPALSAAGLPCLCGCKQDTITSAARFLPGHDAKLRKTVIKAGLAWDAVPEIARPFFLADRAEGEATAGLFLVDPTTPRWLRDAKADRARKAANDEVERRVAEALRNAAGVKEAIQTA